MTTIRVEISFVNEDQTERVEYSETDTQVVGLGWCLFRALMMLDSGWFVAARHLALAAACVAEEQCELPNSEDAETRGLREFLDLGHKINCMTEAKKRDPQNWNRPAGMQPVEPVSPEGGTLLDTYAAAKESAQ